MTDLEDRHSNTGEDRHTDNSEIDHVHLDDELLNGYVDSRVSTAERTRIESHLARCERCRLQVRELRATVQLLRALPIPSLHRSFQLSPEVANRKRSIWDRIGLALLPALPAMRAATVAVALLLFAVSIRNVVTDSGISEETADVAPGVQSTQVVPAVTIDEQGRNSAQIPSNQETSTAGQPLNDAAPVPGGTQPEEAEIGGDSQLAADADVSANDGSGEAVPGAAGEANGIEEQPPAGDAITSTDDRASSTFIPGDSPVRSSGAGAGAASTSDSTIAESGLTASDEESEPKTGVVAFDQTPATDSAVASSKEPADFGSGGVITDSSLTTGSTSDSFAMSVPSSPEITSVPDDIAGTNSSPLPAATASSVQVYTPTPLVESQESGSGHDSVSFWRTAQIALGALLAALLVLLVALQLYRTKAR